MMKKGLVVAIILGLILAAYPTYGSALDSVLWSRGSVEYENAETHEISGTVVSVDMTYSGAYLNLNSSGKNVRVLIKGEWILGNETLEYTELVQNYIDAGDVVSVSYTDNPRWGPMAEQIVLWDGSVATKG